MAAVVPVPVMLIVCGEFAALPVTVNVAVSAAADVGVTVTWIWQEVLTARLAEQFLDWIAKSVLPEIRMPLMAKAEVEEVLVKVTV